MQRHHAWITEFLWHYRKISVWERVLSGRDEDTRAADGLRWAGPDDTGLLTQAGYSADQLAARFDAPCRVAVAVSGETLLAASWYVPAADAPRPHEWCRLDLPDDGMWNFDLRIAPDTEAQRLCPALFAFAHAGLRGDGYRYVHYIADERAPDDMRAYAAAGYVRVEDLVFLRIAQRSFLWLGRRFARGRWFPGNDLVLPTHRL